MFGSILEVADVLILIGVRSLKSYISQSYISRYVCDQCAFFMLRLLGFLDALIPQCAP